MTDADADILRVVDFWWMACLPMLTATVGCIPDVNATGIRGEGGSGTGASGTGASGTETISVIYNSKGPNPEVPGGGQDCVTVECPTGYNVLSGGGAWDGGGLVDGPLQIVLNGGGGDWDVDDSVTIHAQRPRANDAGPNGWVTCADSDVVPEDHLWFVEAVCL